MRPPRKQKRRPPSTRRFPTLSIRSVRNRALRRILKRVSDSRFLTLSICLHAMFILMVGGTVLFKVGALTSDFQAGEDGILTEASRSMGPEEPAVTEREEFQFKPAPPEMTVPVDLILTSSPKLSAFKVTSAPRFPQQAMNNVMKDKLAGLGKTPGIGPAAGRSTGAGGARTATIFGRKIVASRLGVILDVSASGHSKLGTAVTEIQRGFADATMILYPGCGMMQFAPEPQYQIRKFSDIRPSEIVTDPKRATTADQLAKALTVETFQKMTKLPTVKDTLFVAWYEGSEEPISQFKLIGYVQVAIADLIMRGVDTIYWFSDFADPIDPRMVDLVSAELKTRRIVLHAHNFAGTEIPPEITNLVNALGGTLNQERTY